MPPTSTICGDVRPRKDSTDSEDELKYLDKLPNAPDRVFTHRKFRPLVVIFVGLPGRGKTVLAHKLERYLQWTNRKARVYSVSSYRRKHIESYDSHNLFRVDNVEAFEIRQLSIHEAQEDATEWLKNGGEIAIIDGPHATKSIRQNAYEHFNEAGVQVLFVECICDDEELLENNEKEILQFSKDYRQMSAEKASIDFHYKIEHYKEQYEPMDAKIEVDSSFIKVFNGGQNMLVHRLTGPLSREVLQFISCFQPVQKTYYFSRHGESEFNTLGKIGGDASLSARGRMYAAALARYFNDAAEVPDLRVWTSEKKRTKQTANDIKAPKEHIAALNELDAGVCEGLSYEEMHEMYPREFAWRDQDKLRYRYPWGESYVDIMNRLQPILTELESENNLLVISHQAVLRCILGYFLNKKMEELPYINVPLHTIIKLTTCGYKYKMEVIKLNVECVDTYRTQPQNCTVSRKSDDALKTVPAHYDTVSPWILSGQRIQQH